ncbi:MAG: hypothetical protein GY719_05450 [bacterium]|nr:hypothetical protein [bacterium]
MAIRYFMDHHVRRAVSDGLRSRDVDVLTAFEDDSHRLPDSELLDRATELGRVLFTQDDDLLAEARMRQERRISFPGVIYGHQLKVSISGCIDDLELIAKACEPEEMADRVEYLPLR